MNSLLDEFSLMVGSTGAGTRAGAFQHIINYLEKRMNSIVKKKSQKDIKLCRGMKMKGVQRAADGPPDTNWWEKTQRLN